LFLFLKPPAKLQNLSENGNRTGNKWLARLPPGLPPVSAVVENTPEVSGKLSAADENVPEVSGKFSAADENAPEAVESFQRLMKTCRRSRGAFSG